MTPPDVVLAVLLVGCVVTDLLTQKIKNVLTFPVMLTGIAMAPLFAVHWWDGLAGLFAALLLAIPGWWFGGAIRAGDVKMLAAAGSLMGPEAALRAVVFTYVLAFPFGLVVLAMRGRLKNLWRFWVKGDRTNPTLVAYAPMIAIAVGFARIQPWPNLWGSM